MSAIDLHTHILAGVDDGPQDLDGSLAIARAQVAAGVSVVAATPHVLDEYPNGPGELEAARDALQAALDELGVALRIVGGGEVGLSYATQLDDGTLEGLRLGGGPWLLVEPPLTGPGFGIEQHVGQLHARGHRLVIAHPERCKAFHQDPELLDRLVAAGALAQLTASSLRGDFGGSVRQLARHMVSVNLVHLVASDTHDVKRRAPGLRDVVRGEVPDPMLDWLTSDVPNAIVRGERIPARPADAERRRRRPWFSGR